MSSTEVPSAMRRAALVMLFICGLVLLAGPLTPTASAAPLTNSLYDSGDANQVDGADRDWQYAQANGMVASAVDDANCFGGGQKEDTPNAWSFTSEGTGCTPSKSNVIADWQFSEMNANSTFAHFSLVREGNSGNSFLTFEFNQSATSWTNGAGTTIPCRRNNDLLISFEPGSATPLNIYRWTGDGSGPVACPNGANGSFSTAAVPAGSSQSALNAAAITNYLSTAQLGGSLASGVFGEAALNIPAVMNALGASQCVGFYTMHVHTRSSASISSSLIDYTQPLAVNLVSCAAIGRVTFDTNNNGVKDSGEPAQSGVIAYVDTDDDGVRDAGEPFDATDAAGDYYIENVTDGTRRIRLDLSGSQACTSPSPNCFYSRTFAQPGSSTGNDFLIFQPAIASGTIYQDTNANATQNVGESGLSGWTVWVDTDSDGIEDVGEPFATTDGSGAYAIIGIGNGTFPLRAAPGSGTWVCSMPSNCAVSRTFTGGATTTQNFGAWQYGQISGTKFEDLDADGVQDPGESGLSGFTFYWDVNANSIKDIGEPSATSNGSGAWTITGITPGISVVIREDGIAGWTCSAPAPCTYTTTLTSGQSASADAFGNWTAGSLSGTVVDDLDGDGALDVGESGRGSVTVYLDSNSNGSRDVGEPTTTTDGSGAYSFGGLPPGSYRVRADLSGGATCTVCSQNPTVVSGQNTAAGALLAWWPASMSGRVYEDAAADGSTSGDSGRTGITIYVDANDNGSKDSGEPSATTDGSGDYTISGLAPGARKLRLDLPATFTCSFPASPCSTPRTLQSGESVDGQDFAAWTTGAASGTVWDDVNGNGTRDAGDDGLAGVVAYADLDDSGTRDGGEPSDASDGSGAYSMTGFDPGSVSIRVDLTAPETCTDPDPCTQPAIVVSSGDSGGLDFGVFAPATIGGNVFEDLDGSTTLDGGEGGYAGITVYADLDDDGVKDAGEPSATTNGSGDYAITGLVPGTYKLRLDLGAGRICSAPDPCERSVTVTRGQSATAGDFGVYAEATITGLVFSDDDGDGSQNGTEGGAPGAVVFIDEDDDGTRDSGEPEVTAASDGTYSLTGLVPGTYVLRLDPVAGHTCTAPASCRISTTVASGQTLPVAAFGERPAGNGSISGSIYQDGNADGSRDPGEDGLAGERAYADLDDSSTYDVGEPTSLTGANGDYSITGLPDQTFKVRVVVASGWTCSDPVPCSQSIPVAFNEAATAADFGLFTTAQASGTVRTDANGDGDLSGDAGRGGVAVYADLDDDGALDPGEPTATTDSSGDWTITGLDPATVTFRLDLPGTQTCSAPSPSCSRTTTVKSSDAASVDDFGVVAEAQVSGAVRSDSDADGSISGSDAPVSGIVTYLDLDDDGVRDAGEPSVTTDVTGAYSYTGLAPGDHRVRLDLPAGTSCSVPAPCRRSFTATSGSAQTLGEFGVWVSGTATGVVRDDLNGNGNFDGGEPVLGGVTVYADLDGDGQQDPGEPSTTTAPDGSWTIAGLPPGTVTVRVVPSAGSSCTIPSGCALQVALTSGATSGSQTFGLYRPVTVAPPVAATGGATITIFDDVDADGRPRENGEGPLEGWTVYVDLNGNGSYDEAEPRGTSGPNGSVTFAGVPTGTFAFRVIPPSADFACGAGCTGSVTISSGQTTSGELGGYGLSVVTGHKYLDETGRGGASPTGKTPLAGWTIFVDENGNGRLDPGEPSAVTDETGYYGITRVKPGKYLLLEVPPAGSKYEYNCSFPASCVYDVDVRPRTTVSDKVFVSARTKGASIRYTCSSRRSFVIRVKKSKRGDAKVVSATVWVNGRKVATRERGRITSPVVLIGLARGTYSVVIKAKLSNGKTVTETRRYRTCTKKIVRTQCASRRIIQIHPRKGAGNGNQAIVRSTVWVNGRKIKTYRNVRQVPLDLTKAAKGTYTVSITSVLVNGRTVKDKRVYRTCA